MGLASALNTALTGLSAAETIIDVVGNNVANANTVGFKSSEVAFATQFLQTQSLGAAPTAVNGGVNPQQTGLGVTVAEVTPNFTQGTIQISSSPSDLAIQGDGFLIVQGSQGEELYTRDGGLQTNAQNELVTASGDRLLGLGVNENFEIQTTQLVPLTIPLGTAAVAQATQNVFFEGSLTPTGDIATQAQIIQTGPLGDAAILAPASSGNPPLAIAAPGAAPTTVVNGAGALSAGTYRYYVTFVDGLGNESEPSPVSAGIATAAGNAVDVTIPVAPAGAPTNWATRRVYRTDNTGLGNAFLVGTSPDVATTNVFNDTTADALLGNATHPQLNTDTPNGTYNYLITFANDLNTTAPSRPATPGLGPITVANDRILLSGLPNAGSLPPQYNRVNIYRSVANQPGSFFLVTQLDPAVQTTYIDSMTDADLALQPPIDLDGPKIQISNTNLVDVLRRDGTNYEQVFQVGTLTFTPQKGGRTLAPQTFEITATTKVVDLLTFMNQALGIQVGTDPLNPIPASATASGSVSPGGSVTLDGRLQLVGNNGVDNAINVGLSSLQMNVAGSQTNINLPFGAFQTAIGESATADFIAYDSLGIPLNVRVTVVQEARDSVSTTYRWFADSPGNDPVTGANIAVGTGLIRFDGSGNVLQVTNSTVSIDRRSVSSVSPLEFELDFSQLSGLATASASLSASRQDGSAAGTLTSFIIGGDGKIRGVFSNGVSRDLGQILLARFANPAGLEQRGQNKFAAGVNSGLPIVSTPGGQGTGSIIAGAKELSNTDIGKSLIDLITASTQYRGNTRVITAAQQLLDELLNLRR